MKPTLPDAAGREGFDFRAHLQRQREWSSKTFGPGPRTAGLVDHIRKELCEIEADPTDVSEWIDVTILALDGAWRAGYSPDDIIAALVAKQTKNEGRVWPDWRTAPADKAIEHDRLAEDGRRYRELIEMHSGEFPQFREQLDSVTADRDRLAARCEGLEAALQSFVRCVYPVAREIRQRGYDWRETDLHIALCEARAALSPPASDAGDSTDGETK